MTTVKENMKSTQTNKPLQPKRNQTIQQRFDSGWVDQCKYPNNVVKNNFKKEIYLRQKHNRTTKPFIFSRYKHTYNLPNK